MGFANRFWGCAPRGAVRIAGCWALMVAGWGAFLVMGGCQYQAISALELQIHQSRLDKQGLTSLYVDRDVKVSCAPPAEWDKLPLTKNLIYSHEQWRSPDHRGGMGVAYMHTPFPLSAQMIIWFASRQYGKDDSRPGKGRLIASWTDSLGRDWFEGENDLYHIRGYAMTHGCDAWLVYSGYRVKMQPSAAEKALAAKGAESVAPLGMEP